MNEWTEQREQEIQTRALTTADDAMVERAARAFYEYPAPNLDVRTYWDRINAVRPEAADLYRLNMKTAIEAALGIEEWS